MKIIKMNPQGFCHGVIRAIKQIEEILDIDTYEKPLYMYGSLVHNKHVVKHFNDRGIINIDSINNINHGTIIITAHGLSKIKQQEMINKGLNIIDATCTEVKKTHEYIEQKINDGYDVIYYGKKNHAECMAVLENFPTVHLIEKKEDINNLIILSNKIFFTSQTTMSYFDLQEIIDELNKKYQNIERNTDICQATRRRQEAIMKDAPLCDLCLIVGDPTSNNTMKLKEVCEQKAKTKAILIENVDEIDNISLNDIQILGITSGASTPNRIVEEIITKIKSKYNVD